MVWSFDRPLGTLEQDASIYKSSCTLPLFERNVGTRGFATKVQYTAISLPPSVSLAILAYFFLICCSGFTCTELGEHLHSKHGAPFLGWTDLSENGPQQRSLVGVSGAGSLGPPDGGISPVNVGLPRKNNFLREYSILHMNESCSSLVFFHRQIHPTQLLLLAQERCKGPLQQTRPSFLLSKQS